MTMDVVIVGAGPTGLTLSAALKARGIDHVLLDAAAQGANTSRAAVIHARTLEVLDDLGIAGELVRRGIVVPQFTVRDRDRALMRVPFAGLPTRFPFTLMLPQSETEQILSAYAGQVRWQSPVTAVEGGVVTLAGGEQIEARYVVGCDGLNSVVRQQSGIGFTGGRYPESFVLADVHLKWPFPRDEVHLFFAPSGLVVVAPLPGERYRIVATLDDAPEQPSAADVQALLDARGPEAEPAEVTGLVWSSRFRVQHRLADHYRRGPVFLAGDAAHVHSPAGGQGMNTGIQDAVTLARALAGEIDLDAYETLRRPVATQVVATTHRMTRAATLRNPMLRAVRNSVLSLAGRSPAVQRRLALSLAELTVPK
ncbi:FAD-dependent monooxygenase [Actinoplanes bogorensis]|uniref:FAD-dependent monooxygenase n=1 Tax=Paractinoplanes bogorensis TaxID=1610840 RepID=A0ABS5YRX1_9ACTN|nr:FAD-dependent monooxygenase [Actinoplanes bogorensis]MBU2666197.1 FAD-dependent monooxygenase [Actinoplanes bogorensis]